MCFLRLADECMAVIFGLAQKAAIWMVFEF
jgi:hypothetical protein